MKKKTKTWLIVLGVFVVIGLIGSLFGGKDKPAEVRVVAAETASPAPSATPAAAEKPVETEIAAVAPASDPDATPELLVLETTAPAETAPADRTLPAAEATPEPEAEEHDYVLNMNTMKFHYPSCSSVKDIKDGNRKDVHATRDSVISQGYQPCGKCKP